MNDKVKTISGCPVGAETTTGNKTSTESINWAIGPGSMSWRVLKDPAVFFIGMLRTSMLIPLHPPFAAAAELDKTYLTDPLGRFKRIALFAYMAGYGSHDDAIKVSKFVIKSHTMIKGTEPITQLPFQANSEYELALTSVVQTYGFLTAYEELHGKLPTNLRDQFVAEQKLLGAVIGVNPDHVPATYEGLRTFLNDARKHWAGGLISRRINSVFIDDDFPTGSLIGDLSWYKRKPIMWALRAISDMALLIMGPDERLLIAINRKPKLRWRWAVKGSFHLFSKFMCSKKGNAIFSDFLGKKVGEMYMNALAIENSPRVHTLQAKFVVPDPASCFCVLPDLVRNWPGSPAEYRLGEPMYYQDSSRVQASANG